jgi:hypothetical protein
MRSATRSVLAGLALALASGNARLGAAPTEGFELSFGGSFRVGLPLGEFADQVGTAYGLGGHMAWARPGRAFGLRLEASGLIYGSETKRVPVGRPELRQSVEVETTNGMATLGLGPQFVAPRGKVRPYLTAFAGFSYFSTDSTVREDPFLVPTAFSTNYDDTVFAYGGGIGILIPLGQGSSGGLALDIGARFVGGGQVRYLAEGDLQDRPGSGVTFNPRETDANRFEFHIGLTGLP